MIHRLCFLGSRQTCLHFFMENRAFVHVPRYVFFWGMGVLNRYKMLYTFFFNCENICVGSSESYVTDSNRRGPSKHQMLNQCWFDVRHRR